VHGSIDWCRLEDGGIIRRIRPGIIQDKSLKKAMIWPAATKYQEAQRDPYAQIISRMRQTLKSNKKSDKILQYVDIASAMLISI